MDLEWATLNGAEFLGIDDQFGSLKKNTSPGIFLIEDFNISEYKFNANSKIRKV